MKTTIKDILLFVGILTILYFLIFGDKQENVYNVSPVKNIETRIDGQETIIKHKEVRIIEESKIVDEISRQIDSLEEKLSKNKAAKDTVMIIQIQDTMISALEDENGHLRVIVDDQDSIISAQRYIIDSKDTIIAIGDANLKRVKKQRNISVVINAIQAAALILKP